MCTLEHVTVNRMKSLLFYRHFMKRPPILQLKVDINCFRFHLKCIYGPKRVFDVYFWPI